MFRVLIAAADGWGRDISSHSNDQFQVPIMYGRAHVDGLVQERRNSSVLAMELRLSCTNPAI